MGILLVALLIGVVAGLRGMTAPAVASWGAFLGWVPVAGTWLSFMGSGWTAGILTVLALAELVADQLPTTPSRTLPMPFGVRIVTGALSGATIGAAGGMLIAGAIAGIVGAVIGTLGGAKARAAMAAVFQKDMPAAFIEDAVAIGLGLILVAAVR